MHCTSSIFKSKMTLGFIILSSLVAFVYADTPASTTPIDNLPKLSKIIGGKNAGIKEFPHQVSLQWGYPPLVPFQHLCGGSIISKKWILTAGHCISDLPKTGYFMVRAGKLSIANKESTEQSSPAAAIFVHREYRGSVSPYDIALIKLLNPFKFNKYVNAIRLPKRNTLPKGEAILSGWGSISRTAVPVMPAVLQKATLNIIDLETCRTAMTLLGQPWGIHDTNICAGPLNGARSACNGDSGGPLIKVSDNGTKVIVGISSWGLSPCAQIGAPGVFVRVSAFVEWINLVAKTFK